MARIICKLCRVLPVLLLLFSSATYGQDTLPSFSAQLRPGNRVLIGWNNTYGKKIRQISIQRSADSLKNFKTIMTLPDPTIPQNGYLDQKVVDTNHFYRLYILLDSGRYQFSVSKRPKRPAPPASITPAVPEREPAKKPAKPAKEPTNDLRDKVTPPVQPVPIPERFIQITRRDSIIGTISEKLVQRFRDSISLKTKDTLVVIHPDTLLIKPFVPAEVYRPSRYIFMDKSGLLHIELPDARRKKYLVKFFEADKTPLFDIKEVSEEILLLDKSNFLQEGWYFFELYEDNKLKEKNRFFIARDF